MNSTAPAPTAAAAPTSARATPTTNASRHHAVTSSAAAHPRATTPVSVLSRLPSARMRARTGNAVTDSATPRNSAKLVNGTPRCDRTGYSHSASPAPSTNGTTMLACEIATVACARCFSFAPFSSSPTRKRYNTTPSCATACSAASTFPFGSAAGSGTRACMASGDTAPRRDGPSRIPATTSPMTGGWPTYRNARPRTNPSPITAASVARTCATRST